MTAQESLEYVTGDILKHKAAGCKSVTGWRFINGDCVCYSCWPPTDMAAVVIEGAA